jgi:arylsulfatase A-like enzyme
LNIVYMHTHDTGRYIEPYGYAVSTPNLMQLAKEGVLLRWTNLLTEQGGSVNRNGTSFGRHVRPGSSRCPDG